LPPPQPVELTSVAYDVYRQFEVWLKNKGLMRLADADETYANEAALATCLRGSLGIGQVVELDEAGDVRCSPEQADELRFAQRKSPQTGEFGGFSIHAGVTVHAADSDGRERLIRYCARPALSMERLSETSDGITSFPSRAGCVATEHDVGGGRLREAQTGGGIIRARYRCRASKGTAGTTRQVHQAAAHCASTFARLGLTLFSSRCTGDRPGADNSPDGKAPLWNRSNDPSPGGPVNGENRMLLHGCTIPNSLDR